jgi:hypothetical protein
LLRAITERWKEGLNGWRRKNDWRYLNSMETMLLKGLSNNNIDKEKRIKEMRKWYNKIK